MKRLLITGSRDWADSTTLLAALLRVRNEWAGEGLLVHGDARGADRMAAHIWTCSFGLAAEAKPAAWRTRGKRAGYIRNAEMVNRGADLCLAFIRNGSRGATMCADLAEKAGIPVRRYEVTS